MRTVLFLAYLFPPIANSGTRRSLSFVNHLPDSGWNPLVLTLQDPPARICDPTLLDEVRPGTRIERAPLAGRSMALKIARALVPAARREKVAEGLTWRLNNLLQTPDETAPWYLAAVERGVQLHRETGFDMIYASGWPWTAFLVARAISLRTGVPYVLDYRDTWTPTSEAQWESPSRAQAWFNPRLERFAAKHAAAIVTVTQALVPVIGKDSGRAHVHRITNGFEPSDFAPSAGHLPPPRDNFVRISYTGIWRPDYGLHGLYQAIALLKERACPGLERLKVIAAGFKAGPARDMGVADYVEECGYVEHARAIGMMRDADLLYLSVPTGFYANACLPGKLFEYMGSANPILAVVPAESEVAQVLGEVGGAIRVDPGDIEAIAQVLVRLVAGECASIVSPRNSERLQRYTRAATAAQLAQVFDNAAVASSKGTPQ